MPDFQLSATQRATLDALCRRIVPAAYAAPGDDSAPLDLAAAVEQRLREGDPVVARRIATVLAGRVAARHQAG
jgi:hypothetical protein